MLDRIPNIPQAVNMPELQDSEQNAPDMWQGSEYASSSEMVRLQMVLGSLQTIFWKFTVFWICIKFSIYQDFECIRNLNVLDFHRV